MKLTLLVSFLLLGLGQAAVGETASFDDKRCILIAAAKLLPVHDMRIVEASSRVTGSSLSNSAQLVQNRIVAVGGSDVAAINLIRAYREITDTDAAQITAARGDVQRIRQLTTKLLEKWLERATAEVCSDGGRRVLKVDRSSGLNPDS